jgi:XTP/dITP diphosphohydrolase
MRGIEGAANGGDRTVSKHRKFDGDRLIVASHNQGKVREIRALLLPLRVNTLSLVELGLASPEETEQTFAGNARTKALTAAMAGGAPALSDDSGLSIGALNGRPGVHTADWAETDDGRNFDIAMRRAYDEIIASAAPEPWICSFFCALCLAWPDGHAEAFLGRVDGRFVWPPRGDKGFGYDPIFVRDGEMKTFGEIAPEEKHSASHRSDAFRQLVAACFAEHAY